MGSTQLAITCSGCGLGNVPVSSARRVAGRWRPWQAGVFWSESVERLQGVANSGRPGSGLA